MLWGFPPLRIATIGAVLLLAPAFVVEPSAQAQSYAAGLDAYDRGDFDEALRILKPLAEQGDPRAQYGLGKIYETGGGPIAASNEMAVAWYRKSAAQGIAAAQNNLALMYAQGRGVTQNKPQAYALWEAAARGGHSHAQYNMGLLFYRGEGVERDLSAAADWFGMAAENGLAEAQFAVAEMHRLGVGLPQDDRKALGWYQLAGAQGHEAARERASRLRGEGVSPVEVAGTFGMPQGRASEIQLAGSAPPQSSAVAEQPAARPQSAPGQTEAAAEAGRRPEAGSVTVHPTLRPAVIAETGAPEVRVSADAQTSAKQAPQRQVASAAAADVPSARGGAYSLWLASMGEEGAARQMTARLASQYGPSLGGADVAVRRVEVGGSDVFYRVVAGSWPSVSEAKGVCAELRRADPTAFCKVFRD